MFMLTHAHVALNVLKGKKLTAEQRDQLIVGSILPDAAELGIVDEKRAHTEGRQFLRYLGKEYHYFGIGALLHGTEPKGLDYYTHHGFYGFGGEYVAISKGNGYITQKLGQLLPLLQMYKQSLGNIEQNDALHFIVEFCFDHLIARKNPALADVVFCAMKRSTKSPVVLHFAHYFNVDKKQLRRLKHIVKSRIAHRVLHNFSTIEGTAHNFQDFIFWKSMREQCTHRYRFLGKMAHVTRSSLGFLRQKVHDKSLVQLFERCVAVVEKDYDEFLERNVAEMRGMIKKEKLV